MNLKIEYKQDLPKEKVDYVDAVKKLGLKEVRVSTNKLICDYDKKDSRNIKSIKNIKLIYKLDKGCLILKGNIGCNFTKGEGFCGKFYILDVVRDESANFDRIKGVVYKINFSDPLNAISNDDLMGVLNEWVQNPNLDYNIEQFDEFMELFEFYKSLSSEHNSNNSYPVKKLSKPYYFIPIEEKDEELLEEKDKEEVTDINGVIKGYRLSQEKFDQLSNETKEKTRQLVDVEIVGCKDNLKKLNSMGSDSIYLSNYERVTEKDVASLVQFQVVSIGKNSNKLVISGELKDVHEEFQYLNLYDMGQKIKVESIEKSLKLIKQGASGLASELLGYLIGDSDMPNNAGESDAIKEQYMKGLNNSQRKAFLMAVDGSPVSLIKGPPGTGKTHVINAIVQYIVKELGEKVIISSQTHIAIDNVLDKLMANYDPIIPNRITNRRNKYSDKDIDMTLYKTWGVNFAKHNERASDKELAGKVLESLNHFKGEKSFSYSTTKSEFSVIGATTTTSAISGTKGLKVLEGYNWLIIDEVSKCPITEVLRYLPYVEKIIMVGDDFQLAPLLEFNKKDVENYKSYDEDKFERLKAMYENSVFAKTLTKAEKCGRVVLLNENFRSVKNVLALYNCFYDNQLIGKREDVKPGKIHLNSSILDDDKDVFFVEVLHGKEVRDGKESRYNIEELGATKEILKELMKTTINPVEVSVAAIFPYSAQIFRFQKENVSLINEAKRLFKSFEIDTVDAFQGKEAEIVLCNTVVADITGAKRCFLKDFRRINVSMSRAKDKLIIFGNSSVLSSIEMSVTNGPERKFFKDIIDHIESKGKKIIYNEGEVRNENRSKSTLNFG